MLLLGKMYDMHNIIIWYRLFFRVEKNSKLKTAVFVALLERENSGAE